MPPVAIPELDISRMGQSNTLGQTRFCLSAVEAPLPFLNRQWLESSVASTRPELLQEVEQQGAQHRTIDLS